jgi:agmatine/peptidylarginine deiminase
VRKKPLPSTAPPARNSATEEKVENAVVKKTFSGLQSEQLSGQGKPIQNVSRYFYSLFAALIFLCGVYAGTKYLPGSDLTSQFILGNDDNPRRVSILNSEPEDFFPVAEFRKQSAILIGCHNQLQLIPQLYADIANAVDQKVPLFGIVSTEVQAQRGVEIIHNLGLPTGAMRFLVIPSNSIWIRDYAPFILRYDDDRALMVDAKYHTRTMREKRKQDDYMGFELARFLDLPVRSIPLVLEGGNFISNGDGLLLTSSKTLAVNKEGEYSHNQLISMFNDYLGVNGVYAVHPLEGEPNGHIDMFMTMLGKNLAIIAEIDPSVDPENSARLNKTAEFISTVTTSAGPIIVKRIPMPPKWGSDWRSYTNIIMANGVLLMPSFSNVDKVMEDRAEAVYRSSLPLGWDVKRINCDKLVALHGQLHCISYSIPHFISIEGLLERSFPRTREKKLRSTKL